MTGSRRIDGTFASPRQPPERSVAMNGLTVTQTLTTPTRPGKKPRPVWNVAGNTAGLEEAFRDLGGRKYRGAWSFFSDPTADIAELTDEDKTTFAEQRETSAERSADRAERYSGYSQNAATRSAAASERSRAAVAGIPFGQPILVGHHSEKRHRRDLAKSDNAMRKAVDEDRKTSHWERRAAGAERNAEPDAEKPLGFIQRRLEEAEKDVRKMTRRLAGDDWPSGYDKVPEGAELERTRGFLAAAEEKAAYWRGLIEARGGVRFSRENVRKGDVVAYSGKRLGRVVRVNPKTVSVEDLRVMMGDRGWPGKVPYAEIREVVPASRVAELEATAAKRDEGPRVRPLLVLR